MYHKALHIDTLVYHLLELCKDSVLVLKKVSFADQVVDSLTKSTPRPAFEKHSDSMLGVHTMHPSNKMQVESRSSIAREVDEMEGIELEAEDNKEGVESGLSAFEVSKSKASWCARGDGEPGQFLNQLEIRLILICFILILWLYCCAQEYDDNLDFRLGIHYAQCMVWMRNAEFYDFHVFPPWERDINQCNMQV
eukprot:1517195-Rhodomonas_salina.1